MKYLDKESYPLSSAHYTSFLKKIILLQKTHHSITGKTKPWPSQPQPTVNLNFSTDIHNLDFGLSWIIFPVIIDYPSLYVIYI